MGKPGYKLFQKNITRELEAWLNITVQIHQVTFELQCCIRNILGTDECYAEEKPQNRKMCYICDSKRKRKLHTYVNMQKTCVLGVHTKVDNALKLNGNRLLLSWICKKFGILRTSNTVKFI